MLYTSWSLPASLKKAENPSSSISVKTRVPRSQSLSEFSEFYKEQIDTLNDKLEAATYRNGYLEAQLAAARQELKQLPDLSAKATKMDQLENEVTHLRTQLAQAQQGVFVRFAKWFLGRS